MSSIETNSTHLLLSPLHPSRYSSIGTKKDTLPNLKLMIKKENGNLDYLPAYKLEDENNERINRKKERS